MTPEQSAAIERLRELERHVLPLNWQISETNDENVLDANGLFVAECCSDDEAAFIVALRNESVPLLIALAAENERLRAERDALQARVDGALKMYLDYSKSNSAIAREAIEILKGEQSGDKAN